MNESNFFVFGSKIFPDEPKRDAIASLPLELSWRIFSFLDERSLRVAYHLHPAWARIIAGSARLWSRLQHQDLVRRFGPKLAKHMQKKLKRKKKKNFALRGETVYTMKKTIMQSKRGGGDIIIFTKRFKLF